MSDQHKTRDQTNDESSLPNSTSPVVNSILTYVLMCSLKATRDNLVKVLQTSYCVKELDCAKAVLWRHGDATTLGRIQKRVDTQRRPRKDAVCSDIVDGMRKLDQAKMMPYFVCDAVGMARLPRSSPEDLNIVTMDERMRDLERSLHQLRTTSELHCSSNSNINDRVESLELAVSQHEDKICQLSSSVAVSQSASGEPSTTGRTFPVSSRQTSVMSSTADAPMPSKLLQQSVPGTVVPPASRVSCPLVSSPRVSSHGPSSPRMTSPPVASPPSAAPLLSSPLLPSSPLQSLSPLSLSFPLLSSPPASSPPASSPPASSQPLSSSAASSSPPNPPAASGDNKKQSLHSYADVALRPNGQQLSKCGVVTETTKRGPKLYKDHQVKQTPNGFMREMSPKHTNVASTKSKYQRRVVLGSAVDCRVKGAAETRNLFLYRVDKHETVDTLREHMSNKNIDYLEIVKVSKDNYDFCSFRIRVSLAQYNSSFVPELWPYGSRLTDFYFSKQYNKPAANE